MTYVYVRNMGERPGSPARYSVGFYGPYGWETESDWPTAEEAAKRVRWLNGGSKQE